MQKWLTVDADTSGHALKLRGGLQSDRDGQKTDENSKKLVETGKKKER